jgi:hypothetical protein
MLDIEGKPKLQLTPIKHFDFITFKRIKRANVDLIVSPNLTGDKSDCFLTRFCDPEVTPPFRHNDLPRVQSWPKKDGSVRAVLLRSQPDLSELLVFEVCEVAALALDLEANRNEHRAAD